MQAAQDTQSLVEHGPRSEEIATAAGREEDSPEKKASSQEAPPQAAQMPDGTIVILSAENPYRQAAESVPAEAASPPEHPPQVAITAADLHHFYRPAMQLERMARLVRLLAIIDMAFGLMHAMADTWPAAIAALMSYCGYLGARTFRRDLTRIYLVYLMIFALIRVIVSARFIMQSSPEGSSASLPVYFSMTALVQLVIAHFVWHFYSLLPTTNQQARFVQYLAEQHSARATPV